MTVFDTFEGSVSAGSTLKLNDRHRTISMLIEMPCLSGRNLREELCFVAMRCPTWRRWSREREPALFPIRELAGPLKPLISAGEQRWEMRRRQASCEGRLESTGEK